MYNTTKLQLTSHLLSNEGVSTRMKDETMRKGKMKYNMRCETRETNDNPNFPLLDPADGKSISLFLWSCIPDWEFSELICSSAICSFSISAKKLQIQLTPFSVGPRTRPTASTKFVQRLNGFRDFVHPSAGFSSPRQCVSESFLLRYKCWQYLTRSSKCPYDPCWLRLSHHWTSLNPFPQ